MTTVFVFSKLIFGSFHSYLVQAARVVDARAGRLLRDLRGRRDDFIGEDHPGHCLGGLLLPLGRLPAGSQPVSRKRRLVAGAKHREGRVGDGRGKQRGRRSRSVVREAQGDGGTGILGAAVDLDRLSMARPLQELLGI